MHRGTDANWKRVNMEWISAKKDFPKPDIGQKCLVWLQRRKIVQIVIYEEDEKGSLWMECDLVDIEFIGDDLVTHWMPFPQPPIE